MAGYLPVWMCQESGKIARPQICEFLRSLPSCVPRHAERGTPSHPAHRIDRHRACRRRFRKKISAGAMLRFLPRLLHKRPHRQGMLVGLPIYIETKDILQQIQLKLSSKGVGSFAYFPVPWKAYDFNTELSVGESNLNFIHLSRLFDPVFAPGSGHGSKPLFSSETNFSCEIYYDKGGLKVHPACTVSRQGKARFTSGLAKEPLLTLASGYAASGSLAPPPLAFEK